MPKKVFYFLYATLFLFGCNLFAPEEKDSSSENKQKAKWTLLIHFAIDNDIDYEFEREDGIITIYLKTLEELKGVPYNSNINVLIMMDAYNKDVFNVGYNSRFKDGYYYLKGGLFSDDLVLEKDEINSGDVEEWKRFIDWAVENYPAERYILSIFNHGTGFDDTNEQGTYSKKKVLSINPKGIGFDDGNGDCLSHKELATLTKYMKDKIGKKIDIFYPFACLMGGMELAYELKENVDYILFSEELFPAIPLSYEPFGLGINKNPSISPLDVCKYFCDDIYEFLAQLYIYSYVEIPFTLSVIDTSKIDDLKNSIDEFAKEAISNIKENPFEVLKYINIAKESFKMYSLAPDISNFYYIDLGDFMKNLTNDNSISNSVKEKAIMVIEKLNSAVVYNMNFLFTKVTGLSIFHNIAGSQYQYSLEMYTNLITFGKESKWSEYISLAENSNTAKDPYEPDNDFSDAKEIIVGAPPQERNFHNNEDVDFIKVSLEAGKTYKIETYKWMNDLNTMIFLYDSNYVEIASDDDNGEDKYSKIVHPITSSGIYYIKVSEGYYNYNRPVDYKIDVVEQ